jgi:peptidoglycan hydrolase-like protein with peptidoglycan-binding domain
MRFGTAGDDVAQLETALSALGFAGEGVVVDGVYDAATREAVLSWQRAIGAPADGVVDLGDVVFTPGSIRIGSLERTIGDVVQDGATIMTRSAAETFVIVQLPAADQGLLSVGDAVVVELPDRTEVEATVATVGTVAQAGQTGGAYFEVTIILDDPAAAAGLDEAPVEVAVVTDSTAGVLAVPVTALLALAEGGYAVEVVAPDGSVALIGVDPGLFADGFVEVTGDGLDAGMEVAIP